MMDRNSGSSSLGSKKPKKRFSPPNSPTVRKSPKRISGSGGVIQRKQQRLLRKKAKWEDGGEPPVVVAGPKLFAALAALCVSLLWTVSVLFFSLHMDHGNHGEQNQTIASAPKEPPSSHLLRRSSGATRLDGGGGREKEETDKLNNRNAKNNLQLPPHDSQLWPNDASHPGFLRFLAHCQGRECQASPSGEATTTVLLVVRPPGVLASLVQEFVQALVQTLETPLEVHALRHPPTLDFLEQHKGNQIKMIRIVTAPLLLEAIDMAHSLSTANVSWKEVEEIVRLLVQWQAELNQVVTPYVPATLLVTLQSTLLIPQKNEVKLLHFLNSNDADEIPTVPRDDLARRALQRIDECTQYLTKQVLDDGAAVSNPHEVALQWVEEEMEAATGRDGAPVSDTNGREIAKQVYALLHQPDTEVCAQFPQLCEDDRVKLS